MARTEEVIRAQLEQLVSSYPSLAELQQNNSPSSVWSAVKNVIVQMVRLTEQQNDALIQERLTAEETGYIANREWYIARISEFRIPNNIDIDYSIRIVNNLPTYSEEVLAQPAYLSKVDVVEDRRMDATNRLIAKVLRAGNTPLTAAQRGDTLPDELTALQAYIDSIRVAGVQFSIVSAAPESVQLSGNVDFKPGALSATLQIEAVRNALRTFFDRLTFNSELFISDIADAIQGIEQVRAANIHEINVGSRRGIQDSYAPDETASGHFLLDETTTLPAPGRTGTLTIGDA